MGTVQTGLIWTASAPAFRALRTSPVSLTAAAMSVKIFPLVFKVKFPPCNSPGAVVHCRFQGPRGFGFGSYPAALLGGTG